SLPYLTMDFKYAGQAGFNSVISDIKRDLDEKDQGLVEFLLKGFSEKDLDADFYAAALRQRNRFLREYFRFDLNLRNAKVRYLNAQLGREPDMDVMTGEDPEAEDVDIDGFRFTGGEFEEALKVDNILAEKDLVSREKGLDDVLWDKIDSLATFHYFDIEAVLAYIAKLHIVTRWLNLDEEVGRDVFRRLLKDVRGTYKGVKYSE
ncbi:MAG: DUF2764 family protein, partial [Bacteroidales bacterium]|nr:DUF2764 family protein [Bacteroidales bacterium]